MSDNYTIGSYTITTENYYNALKELGFTNDTQLKLLDTNGDYVLSEDELASVEIEDETEETSSTATVEEQIAQVEEKYEEKLLQIYDQLDKLTEQRRQYYSQMGTADDLEEMDSLIESVDSLTSQISTLRTKIVTTVASMEEEIEEIEASAQTSASSSVLSVSDDGTYTISTGDYTPTESVNIDVDDYTINLTETQQSSLNAFVENWEKNKSRYEYVESKTGVPAELIAAIHWRESSGSFNARLQDGGSLSGYSSWEESAIAALSSSYGTITDDISSWYNYAEHYNGMGYSNKGVSSPYVWAGTSNYTSGKYVADGVYDSGTVDKQCGVAVLLNAIL